MILEEIRKLCADRKITLAALEREVGLGNGVIARWDNMSPRVDNIKKVADYFGVSVDSLVSPTH